MITYEVKEICPFNLSKLGLVLLPCCGGLVGLVYAGLAALVGPGLLPAVGFVPGVLAGAVLGAGLACSLGLSAFLYNYVHTLTGGIKFRVVEHPTPPELK